MIRVSLLQILITTLLFGLAGISVLLLFHKELYSRLSARIAMLILASGLIAVMGALAFSEITSATISSPLTRVMQLAMLILGGPMVLGLLAARFVRRPLQQFNNAIASLEESDYKVRLQQTGIREFDEVFTKFNNLIHRLRNEEKLRKDLVSDTSHELNTPLTTMLGQLTALQEGKYPMTKERLTTLKEQAERLAELVQQLEAYTKARIPDSREPEAIPLRRLCQQLADYFSVDLKQKGVQVKLDIADDLVIHANRDVLYRILTNFLQNTLRYSGATELVIAATTRRIAFSDNGKGVPPESLPYLFERFYRVDKSRNRKTGGLGLGLAIVHELAEQQGWRVHAEHAHPGITFVLTLK